MNLFAPKSRRRERCVITRLDNSRPQRVLNFSTATISLPGLLHFYRIGVGATGGPAPLFRSGPKPVRVIVVGEGTVGAALGEGKRTRQQTLKRLRRRPFYSS